MTDRSGKSRNPERKEPARAEPDPFAQDVLSAPAGASRALLASLLRPRRRRVAATCLVLVLQRGISQLSPLLVAYAIDQAVPALRDDDRGPILAVCLGYLLVVAGSGAYSTSRSASRHASART